MRSKVMIVVKRLHWCCVSCHVVNKHTVSIDEHLKSCHLDLICLSSATSPCLSPELERDDFNEVDLDLVSESDEKTTKEELSEITPSPDLCTESVERTTEREFSEITPSPVSVKTKETVQHERNETTSSQCKSKASNFSKSLIDISDTLEHSHQRMRTRNLSNIPVNLSKTTESTNSKSEVRTRNLTNSSVGMQEMDSQEKVNFSHVRKTRLRQSVHRLTINRKENQYISSVSSTGELDSGKAKEQLKQEHRPQRKRQRRQLNSCSEDVHKEQICNTDHNQSEMEDTEIWKENLKSSGVKTDTDNEASTQKKSRSGHPKCSEKPKETVRKRLKTVDREMKKYCWGGKPVKRSLEITEEEMKRVIWSYIGSEMSRNYDKNTPVHLHPAEVICKPQIAVGNIHTVVDSDAVKSDHQYPMSDEILGAVVGTSVPAIPGRHTGVTKASGTETGNVNASLPPEKGYQRHPVVQLQVYHENVNSCRRDNQRSCNTMCKEPEIVPQTLSIETDDISQTPSAVFETECPPRQCPSASSHETPLAASTILVLPDTDKSRAQNTDDSFKNTPQNDSVCGQQDAFKISKDVEDKCCYFENDGKTTDCEDWVKSRTNFTFSKAKAATSFEQPSKVYECNVCQAKFSTAENLSDHFVIMSHHKAAQCRNCQHPYHNVYDLNFHVFEDHERRSEPFCFDCGEKFQNLATLEKHLHQRKYNCDPKLLDMEYHSCNICETDVPCRYETLRKHYHKHKMTMCFECFVRSKLVLLPDAASVREHKTMHANFCNVCFQDFPSIEMLNDHYPCQSDCVRQEDGRGKLCDRCSQWCPNKASVTLHHKEHKLQVMRKWRVEKWGVGIPCVYCDKVLRNKRNLERHIAQLHSSCRSYNFHCEFCGKGIDSKNILKDHIAVHHLGIKRYSCEYCHLRFACAPTLRRHILKEHATDRQYTCEVCGERFCEKFKLTKHMYVHTGSARFMCEQCGKGFHSSSEFKKHLAVHEDKRVFTCQQCGLEYKRKEHLKRHVQKCTRSGHNNAQADSQIL